MKTAEERFWAKVAKGDDCWIWTGWCDSHGYGALQSGGKRLGAHRFAYALEHGPIPDGLFVCHRCDNPRCVRPDHLFLGTPGDNMRDMAEKGRAARQRATHCPEGHAYTPENTYVHMKNGRPHRFCRACNRAAVARYQRRAAQL